MTMLMGDGGEAAGTDTGVLRILVFLIQIFLS